MKNLQKKVNKLIDRRNFMTSSAAIGLVSRDSIAISETGKEVFQNIFLESYEELRVYRGLSNRIYISAPGKINLSINGYFRAHATDEKSVEIPGILIISNDGRRWQREFSGPAMLGWFGAVSGGVEDSSEAIQAALDYGGSIYGEGVYLVEKKLYLRKEGTFLSGPAASWGTETFKDRALTLRASPKLDSDFILECKNTTRSALRSIGIKNLGIDLFQSKSGGLAVNGAYDASEFRNINITGVPKDKIGFCASPGRSNRTGVIQTTTFENIWALKRGGESTAAAFKTWGIQEALFINCKASHSSEKKAAWELSSCSGITLINSSLINPKGYGLDIYGEKGMCDGVTFITPTFENCLNTVRVRSNDSYLFGDIFDIPKVGDVLHQESSVGTVWQSSALGVYAAMESGTGFRPGKIYNKYGAVVGIAKKIENRANKQIKILNPRVLGAATVGVAAGGEFSGLTQSEIHLPDDSNGMYIHKYTADDTAFENNFKQARHGQMPNPGKFNQLSGFSEPFYTYGLNWPWVSNIIPIDSIPANIQRFTVCKSNQEFFIDIKDTTGGRAIDDYPSGSVIRIYRGSITFRRNSSSSFIIEQLSGNIILQGVWRLAEHSFIIAVKESFLANSNAIMGATVVNSGARDVINIALHQINKGIDLGTRFTVRRIASHPMQVTPNAKDLIVGSGGKGKYVELLSDNAFVTIEAVADNIYAIISSGGDYIFGTPK